MAFWKDMTHWKITYITVQDFAHFPETRLFPTSILQRRSDKYDSQLKIWREIKNNGLLIAGRAGYLTFIPPGAVISIEAADDTGRTNKDLARAAEYLSEDFMVEPTEEEKAQWYERAQREVDARQGADEKALKARLEAEAKAAQDEQEKGDHDNEKRN